MPRCLNHRFSEPENSLIVCDVNGRDYHIPLSRVPLPFSRTVYATHLGRLDRPIIISWRDDDQYHVEAWRGPNVFPDPKILFAGTFAEE